MRHGFVRSRSSRVISVVVAGALLAALAGPAKADFQPSVAHLWSHFKASADARYQLKSSFKTLRGTFFNGSVITFDPPLPSAPVVHIVRGGQGPTTECPGGVQTPQAAPGHFCLYEGVSYNLAGLGVLNPILHSPDLSPFGGVVTYTCTGALECQTSGSWAVTRP